MTPIAMPTLAPLSMPALMPCESGVLASAGVSPGVEPSVSEGTGTCETTLVVRIIPRLVVVAKRVELPDVVVMMVSSSAVMRDSMVVSVYLVEEDRELLEKADEADVAEAEVKSSSPDEGICESSRATDEAGDGEVRQEERVLDRLEEELGVGVGDGDGVGGTDCRTDDNGGVYS